jgi:broad specificity polyphosphatase/5'/3'-nucleotidase SurE
VAVSTTNLNSNFLFENVVDLFDILVKHGFTKKYDLLNINLPEASKKVFPTLKVCPLGDSKWTPQFRRINKTECQVLYSFSSSLDHNETDTSYYNRGYITITPLTIDQNDYRALKTLERDIEKIKGEN